VVHGVWSTAVAVWHGVEHAVVWHGVEHEVVWIGVEHAVVWIGVEQPHAGAAAT